jgi:hypothetical protein
MNEKVKMKKVGSKSAKKLLDAMRRHRESIQRAEARVRRTLATGGDV